MDIEKMAANLRARTAMEASDLGLAMMRRWWPWIVGPWLLVTIPLWVAAFAVASPFWAVFWLWLLKPLCDRVPLFVLSRVLFGVLPGARQTLGGVFKLWRRFGLLSLTWRRLNPWRSLLMPVTDLEGLAGKRYSRRCAALTMGSGGRQAFLLSWLYFALTLLLAQAVFLLLQFEPFPTSFQQVHWVLAFEADWGLADIGRIVSLYLGFSLTEPWFVASGFAVYLNRRNEMEGWDVELAFRRIRTRLERELSESASKESRLAQRTGVAGLFLACCLALGGGLAAQDAKGGSEIRQNPEKTLEKVFEDERFHQKRTFRRWRDRDRNGESGGSSGGSSSESGSGGSGSGSGGSGSGSGGGMGSYSGGASALDDVMRVLVWILVIVIGVAVLVMVIRSWRTNRRPPPPKRPAPPEELFGLDIRAESLPEDLPSQAWGLWEKGDRAGCLSLLYRGALAFLVNRRGVDIASSNTEGDCVRLVEQAAPDQAAFFGSLTTAWQNIAYAHRVPAESTARTLCDTWRSQFLEVTP